MLERTKPKKLDLSRREKWKVEGKEHIKKRGKEKGESEKERREGIGSV